MFAEKFKKFLDDNNMAVNNLAKEIGIPQSTMSNWINRGSKPNIEDIVKVCDYFSISVDYLIGRESEDGTIVINEGRKYSPDEENLINMYRKLSNKKREAVVDYIKWQLS
ncbi:MAG: helix-turn-helix domain-containing protein [Clostridia bacterium]|nr:helix-turn-helix domain-containing protein [Clostridia bacterium]MDE7208717.1 helix-turn-helix domain-containing protein [Clostridia bacterium]